MYIYISVECDCLCFRVLIVTKAGPPFEAGKRQLPAFTGSEHSAESDCGVLGLRAAHRTLGRLSRVETRIGEVRLENGGSQS